jgi:hypothetical protein
MLTRSETKWVRVNKRRPCPICGRPDWCTVSADGTVACCMRQDGGHLARNGGWVHRLDVPIAPPAPRVAPNPTNADWTQCLARWVESTVPGDLLTLAGRLGLSAASLRRLGIRWAPEHRAWAFPMRDAAGTVIGIRLRAEDGRKWCVRGSHNGLFVPDGGQIGDQVDEVVIVEGPTDAAAILDCGMYAIGRPSCSGSVQDTVTLCAGRRVVILGDRDEAKTRPNGQVFRPGQDGAQALARAVHGHVKGSRVIFPVQGKDAREWRLHGLTADILRCVIAAAGEWRPKDGR